MKAKHESKWITNSIVFNLLNFRPRLICSFGAPRVHKNEPIEVVICGKLNAPNININVHATESLNWDWSICLSTKQLAPTTYEHRCDDGDDYDYGGERMTHPSVCSRLKRFFNPSIASKTRSVFDIFDIMCFSKLMLVAGARFLKLEIEHFLL